MATAVAYEFGAPEQRAERHGRFYLPELDALRFFAFLAVFACHAWYVQNGPNALADLGTFGVDLFFTLSAYLITELPIREKERQGKIDVSAFYIRRILRIWPLYFVFLTTVFALSALAGCGKSRTGDGFLTAQVRFRVEARSHRAAQGSAAGGWWRRGA